MVLANERSEQQELPLLSVIIPVYKVEDYLRQCVDSVLTQSYRQLEVILVDDGSPDQSGAICEEYAARDPRVRIIHRPNGGLSAARNSGLEIATGDFITYVDSDDWLEPGVYQAVIERFLAEPELDCVGFGVRLVEDQTGRTIEDATRQEELQLTRDQILQFYVRYYDYSFPQTVYTKVYRRALVEGLRFHEGHKFEDCSYTMELLWRLKLFVQIPILGYNYRIGRTGAITTHKGAGTQLRSDVLANLEDLIERHPENTDFIREVNTMLYHNAWYLIHHVYLSPVKHDDYLAIYHEYWHRIRRRPLNPLPTWRSKLKRWALLHFPFLLRYVM